MPRGQMAYEIILIKKTNKNKKKQKWQNSGEQTKSQTLKNKQKRFLIFLKVHHKYPSNTFPAYCNFFFCPMNLVPSTNFAAFCHFFSSTRRPFFQLKFQEVGSLSAMLFSTASTIYQRRHYTAEFKTMLITVRCVLTKKPWKNSKLSCHLLSWGSTVKSKFLGERFTWSRPLTVVVKLWFSTSAIWRMRCPKPVARS